MRCARKGEGAEEDDARSQGIRRGLAHAQVRYILGTAYIIPRIQPGALQNVFPLVCFASSSSLAGVMSEIVFAEFVGQG